MSIQLDPKWSREWFSRRRNALRILKLRMKLYWNWCSMFTKEYFLSVNRKNARKKIPFLHPHSARAWPWPSIPASRQSGVKKREGEKNGVLKGRGDEFRVKKRLLQRCLHAASYCPLSWRIFWNRKARVSLPSAAETKMAVSHACAMNICPHFRSRRQAQREIP